MSKSDSWDGYQLVSQESINTHTESPDDYEPHSGEEAQVASGIPLILERCQDRANNDSKGRTSM